MSFLGFGVVLGILLVAPTNVYAQTEAAIIGTVTDETKGVLPGVTVTATDLATGRQFVGVSDERGDYRLVSMQAGRYRIQAELTSFATVVLRDVELLVGQNRTIRIAMKVAQLAETLTVTGEAPLVDTRSAQVAGNVDRRQMEELPISGRNWMELAMLVKGVTANDVGEGRPGATRDGDFQVNLDGQQITQQVSATFAFGQPGLSREAIAEYQIVTNLFDVTQGRSLGLQVQAIARSGSNNVDGTFYGYFRSDRFNAADFVAKRVLPYQNQQVGFSIGGPIVRDKIHYFATHEYERQPSTFFVQPPGYTANIEFSNKVTQSRFLGRGDWQISEKDHLSVRFTTFYAKEPFGALGGGSTYTAGNLHPTFASDLPRNNHATMVNWSRVLNPNMVQEVKAGYFHYHWNHVPADGVPLTPQYVFPGYIVGARSNYPEEFWQDTPSVRYDLSWHKSTHDLKIGGEFLRWHDSGWWLLRTRGLYTFTALPSDIERRFPLDAWNDPSRWDLSGLDAIALRFERNFAKEGGERRGNCPIAAGCGNWILDIPRPTYGAWFNDTWAVSNKLTVNYGVRYDLDWGALAPPFLQETSIPINNGRDDFDIGYRTNLRDYNNIAPRAGFSYNVTGNNDLVIRGGAGLFHAVPTSNLTFNYQLWNGYRVLTNSFASDGLPGFVTLNPETGPQRGRTGDDYVSGRAPLPPQGVFVIRHDYQLPQLWQSTLGFQNQVGQAMAFDADLTYYRGYFLGQQRDPNLFYDPDTGYNKHPRVFGRPNPDYGAIVLYESVGKSDNLSLATSFTRRYRNNFQGALTYTLMFSRNDTGTSGQNYGGTVNNHFCIPCDWGRALDFQRHTLRANAIYRMPWNVTLAGAYFFGSGNYFQTRCKASRCTRWTSASRKRLRSAESG
jgi:hypothetical protein